MRKIEFQELGSFPLDLLLRLRLQAQDVESLGTYLLEIDCQVNDSLLLLEFVIQYFWNLWFW